MEPPPTYTDEDAFGMLVHSVKANKVCGEVRRLFNLCRAAPFGRIIDPRVCERYALDLVDCFHSVQQVSEYCSHEFNEVRSCVERRQNKEGFFSVAMCEGMMHNYTSCEDPATLKWASYS